MRNMFLLLMLWSISVTTLLATNKHTPQPVKDIQTYVTTQSAPVTAHDIAAYFSPQRTKATNTTTFGTANEFNPSSVTGESYLSIAALSSTAFVVVYPDEGNSLYGTAIIGQVSGTTITYGSEAVFNSNSTLSISVAALSSTKFVVTYEDVNNSENGTAIVGEVSSGTNISYGTAKVFSTNTVAFTVVAALSSTDFVVAYREDNNSFRGVAVIGQVSGTTITNGSAVVFNANGTSSISVTALSSSDFVVAYRDEGGTNAGIAVVGQVSSGTTITYGTAVTFDADLSFAISVAALTNSSFVVSYADNGNSAYGTAIVGQVSGTVITYGTAQVFKSTSVSMRPASIAVMSSTQIVIIYSISAVSNLRVGESIVGTISGNSISFGTAEQFASKTDNPVITQLTNDIIGPPISQTTDYVIAYDDLTDMGHGYARVGDATMALPVELTTFTGEATDKGTLLTWQTAFELNNEGFEIQRSTGSYEEWETIDFVQGRGTTQEIENYTYLDKAPMTGVSYYRLKQVDFDGQYAYSPVVSVAMEMNKPSLQIFPNPVDKQLTIVDGEGVAIIYNALGQAVKEFSILNAQFVVNTTDLPKGQYVLHIARQNGTVSTLQFVK